MKKLAATVLVMAIAALPTLAEAKPKVYRNNGRPLTNPSSERPATIVADFLRTNGRPDPTLGSLRDEGQSAGRGGVTHVRLAQQVNGLRVHGAYARATFSGRGELMHLIDNLVEVPPEVGAASIDERRALRVALAALHPRAGEPAELARSGHVVTYVQSDYFHISPTVERVIAQVGNELAVSFLVQTWSEATNLLHYTLVGPTATILKSERRTNTETYKVFEQSPAESPQADVVNPADPQASPDGWLSGTQSSWLISGNNARAYLDADKKQNQPDAGGAARTDSFVDVLDPTAAPSAETNRNVAIQNLFYHNNLLHDRLYAAGFTESFGNFQSNNFSNGGLGGDPVQAEAQDGGGLDNANFSTPDDGLPPRMQMYLWNGANVVEVGGQSFFAVAAAFGPDATFTGVTGTLQLVNDGTGTLTDGCEPLGSGSLTNKIALIDRGTCDFTAKVKNAQNAGAVAAVVANAGADISGDEIVQMGGKGKFTIPASSVSKNSGDVLKTLVGSIATLRAADPPPGFRDADLDADIIWHEYGHGLTWRMIGDMDGPLAGAIGEGMSDILALVHGQAGDSVIGEYSFSNPTGIRRFPYAGYPLKYGSLNTGTRQEHNDGEVYAAIGWKMIDNYTNAGLTRDDLLTDLVEGMKFTPARPAFEDMRDGILQGLGANMATRECLVWRAFAAHGVGVGATAEEGRSRGKAIAIVTASEVLPAQCSADSN
jgi:extracellular elastinolytic metalloproteinase